MVHRDRLKTIETGLQQAALFLGAEYFIAVLIA